MSGEMSRYGYKVVRRASGGLWSAFAGSRFHTAAYLKHYSGKRARYYVGRKVKAPEGAALTVFRTENDALIWAKDWAAQVSGGLEVWECEFWPCGVIPSWVGSPVPCPPGTTFATAIRLCRDANAVRVVPVHKGRR